MTTNSMHQCLAGQEEKGSDRHMIWIEDATQTGDHAGVCQDILTLEDQTEDMMRSRSHHQDPAGVAGMIVSALHLHPLYQSKFLQKERGMTLPVTPR